MPCPRRRALRGGTAAADPGDRQAVSTDADVAGWILDAARLYDDCRARLDAIRHWDEVTFDGR